MRRRRPSGRELSAEELVSLAESLPGYGAPGLSPMGDQWQAGLREHGYDPIDVFRARFWLRRGKPRGYQWRQGA